MDEAVNGRHRIAHFLPDRWRTQVKRITRVSRVHRGEGGLDPCID